MKHSRPNNLTCADKTPVLCSVIGMCLAALLEPDLPSFPGIQQTHPRTPLPECATTYESIGGVGFLTFAAITPPPLSVILLMSIL